MSHLVCDSLLFLLLSSSQRVEFGINFLRIQLIDFLYVVLAMQLEFTEFSGFPYMQSCVLQVSCCTDFIDDGVSLFLASVLMGFIYLLGFSSCIVKSMKSGSSCPVCKVPFRRRGKLHGFT